MSSLLVYEGGKHYFAPKIVKNILSIQNWDFYVEPFFGAGHVLFELLQHKTVGTKKGDINVVINDIDKHIFAFWKTISNQDMLDRLLLLVKNTPFARDIRNFAKDLYDKPETDTTLDLTEDTVGFAWVIYILSRQSFSARVSKTNSFAYNCSIARNFQHSFSERTRSFPTYHEIIKNCMVESDDAIKVIRRFDRTNSLFYIDPPYLREDGLEVKYRHGITRGYMTHLIEELKKCRGYVLFSHLQNDYIESLLEGWWRVELEGTRYGSGGTTGHVKKGVKKSKYNEYLYIKPFRMPTKKSENLLSNTDEILV